MRAHGGGSISWGILFKKTATPDPLRQACAPRAAVTVDVNHAGSTALEPPMRLRVDILALPDRDHHVRVEPDFDHLEHDEPEEDAGPHR